MNTWALVPVKRRMAGKSRLAAHLPPAQRLALVRAMLAHVLATLRAVPAIDHIALVSPERDEVADDILLLPDADDDLNGSLQAAVSAAAAEGARRVVIVSGDLPEVSAAEIDQLLAACAPGALAVAPDRAGCGTNALGLALPGDFRLQFGAASFLKHTAEAARRGLQVRRVEAAGLAFDIDQPGDLGLAAYAGLEDAPLDDLLAAAERLTLAGHGRRVSYSRKVFIPLTQLCRDVCHYCTFAQLPSAGEAPYLSMEEALAIARAGAAAGCKEALFTLGDKPELRHPAARRALDDMGYATTLDYLAAVARRVFEETGLLPHLNPGVMSHEALAHLKPLAVSMGLMLETTSARLDQRGMPHHGSPDKAPAARLATLEAAGQLAIPFTTGLLIGIGETRRERIEALLAIRDVHARHGHIQEVIVQNFLPKAGTPMADVAPAPLAEQLWTTAVARLILGAGMTIQAPPNLRPDDLAALLRAGVNDWGGVSPVTPDHVNPEAPWPHLETLRLVTEEAGRELVERLAIGPGYARTPERWLVPLLATAVRHGSDAEGHARDHDWYVGAGSPLPAASSAWFGPQSIPLLSSARLLQRAERGDVLSEAEIASLFTARGEELRAVLTAADRLRHEICGDAVTYVVNRNINYTNICSYKCGFCAFSKGKGSRGLRGPAYRLEFDEIGQRALEAHAAGATEVCLQGGIHPSYNGQTYLDILAAVKAVAPSLHIHAFSPLEITHGAQTLGLSLHGYLGRLKDAGLASLPGTAAEILDDEVRAIICDDKISTSQWLTVMRTAHDIGLRSTATIMFGHVEQPRHWARHLLKVRALQQETGGFTEFVPLPFVHMEAPIYRRGLARRGPTLRETLLMHAVARLVLHPWITNIQTSWVKLGGDGAGLCLQAGANDLGGTLMNESISRAAGGVHGQDMSPARLEAIIAAVGRPARRRTTLYGSTLAVAEAEADDQAEAC